MRRRADAMAPLRGAVLKPVLARLRGDRAYGQVRAVRRAFERPAPEQRADAFARLRALLVHARDTSPFWARRMAEARFDPARMSDAAALAALPPLSRTDVRLHVKDMLSRAYDPARLVVHRSGGTTSEPVPFFQARESIAAKNAATLVLRERLGWRRGGRTAFLWGAAADGPASGLDPLRRAKDFLVGRFCEGAVFLPAGDLSDACLDAHLETLRRFRPAVVQGYPSASDLLARRAAERGVALRVPVFVLTAEPVLAAQRARVAAAFDAEVFSFYGARECGWIASECVAERRLHVNTVGVHLEATDDGRLLVTDLANRAMPLIRYEIGDRGALDPEPCPCGDPRPVLARLEGREVDLFTLPSGRRVPGVLADVRGLGFDGHGILDAQFVQDRVDRIDVHWVAGPELVEGDVEDFRRTVEGLFFHEVEVVLHRTDRILPGPNGKVRHCISNVTAAEFAADARAASGRPVVVAAEPDVAPGPAPAAPPARPAPARRPERRRRRRSALPNDGVEPLWTHVVRPLASTARGDRSGLRAPSVARILSLPRAAGRRRQLAVLRSLLVHARATVPWYRDRMAAVGFAPEDLQATEDLRRLPRLTRTDLAGESPRLLSSAFAGEPLVEARTGGTTSAAVPFRQTREAVAWKDAAATVLKQRMGWRPGHRSAFLWGAAQDGPAEGLDWLHRTKDELVRRVVDRSLWLPAGNLSDEQLDAHAERLERFRPHVLQGYPSATDLLARRLLERGRRLEVPVVLLTAEPVLPEQRQRVAAALGAEVFTFYGARECGWVAAECLEHRLHVNTACVLLESEGGSLLVTDLVNRAMPLIRYEIGDRGTLDIEPCPCGDPRPVLATVDGRLNDVFTLPSGRRVPGVVADLRAYRIGLGILEAQLVQPELSRLEVNWVAGPQYHEGDEEVMRERLVRMFYGELAVTLQRVERLRPSPNGKVRYCISHVGRPS
ncbi:MAG: phenylacetate--CoA ligase family protein [Planctomycetes bacterium]|nr:phenylacetate--CoA ligase family protein [Planctomycetota bacterium]